MDHSITATAGDRSVLSQNMNGQIAMDDVSSSSFQNVSGSFAIPQMKMGTQHGLLSSSYTLLDTNEQINEAYLGITEAENDRSNEMDPMKDESDLQ